MSQATNSLDDLRHGRFRQTDKLTIVPLLSNCCGAKVFGELFKNFGRCSDCLEMAEFTKAEL